MARILLGVTGGIAAYKALTLVREFTARSHAVRVIQTQRSTNFVGQASFRALTGAPVLVDEFESDPFLGYFPGEQQQRIDQPISHLALAQRADVFLIAPASAQTIAALAHGFADSIVATAALAANCPLILAPAMNDVMWNNAATQENIATLERRGLAIIAPEHGKLASRGEWGDGRLAAVDRILELVEKTISPDPQDLPLAGKRVLVTAGGTREVIDSVRYIGNRSSGKMGFALARALERQGAAVTVIAANVSLDRDPNIRYIDVESGQELRTACHEAFQRTDLLVMAAAVGDFQPSETFQGKLSKRSQKKLALTLESTVDILTELGGMRKDNQYLIGFSAEHGEGENLQKHARQKLMEKNIDMVIANNIARDDIGFESENNEVTVITADGCVPLSLQSKTVIAEEIIRIVISNLTYSS